jgi:hypothetical protein
MKKILAIVLALVVVVAAFAACGGTKAPEVTPYEGTLEDLTSALYEANPVEFMVGPAMEIDLTDAYAVNSYLGLGEIVEDENGEAAPAEDVGIAKATWSESMLGAQPYSLVLAKVSEGADIEAIKNAMFNGINTRKWICVEADQLRVVSAADVIMLVMVGSEFVPGLADKMVEAFAANVGELTGETLTRG